MAGENKAFFTGFPFEKGEQRFRFTSSFMLLSRKCRATCTGRMLYSRHSLCSRNSRMSSTSCWACRRHRKSSLAVASHLEAAKACLNTCSVAPGSLKELANPTHLPPVVEDGNNEHGNEKDANSFSSGVLRSVGTLAWRERERREGPMGEQYLNAGHVWRKYRFCFKQKCVWLSRQLRVCTFIRKLVIKVLLQRSMKHEQANRGLTDLCSVSAWVSPRKAR